MKIDFQFIACAILWCLILLSGFAIHPGTVTASPFQESDEISQSLELLVEALGKTEDPAVQASLLQGMVRGLEGRRNIKPPENWQTLGSAFSASSNLTIRDLSTRLSQIFGDQGAMDRSLVVLQDSDASPGDRRQALRSLLALKSVEASMLLESLLEVPGLRLDAIRGYAAIENPTAPSVLMRLYPNASPVHQRAIIETLSTRQRYAQVLLNAVRNKKIPRDAIPVQVARSMQDLLGSRFTEVYGQVKSIGTDRQKKINQFKKLLSPNALAKASPSRGRAVFDKTCASCHLLYGTGGKVGPDLTGSNRANLDYILLNSVDPSYDVPDGYRMVTVVTIDGRLINGVVDEEDESKLVLKTAEQPRVVIAKADIEDRKISKKSIMPEGQLDQLKPQEVVDLIKYLRTTEQVEMAK